MLGVYCCLQAFSSGGERGRRFVAGHGFSIGVTSVAEHGLSVRGLQQLPCVGSGGVAHRPHCPLACGLFPSQGSDPCLLHSQVDSQPGDPRIFCSCCCNY